MTATRKRASSGDAGGDGSGSTFRGALLIGVAVIVGVVLLGKGFESGVLSSDSSTPSEEEASGDNGDGGDDATTSTTVTPTTHATAQVRVIVLNGGGPPGSAGATRTTLSAAGYTTLDATDTEPDVAASVVYYTPGFEADAAAIAAAIGITAAPQPMPEPPPQNTPVGQVDVVVVLGPDFTPPG
jgi:hypothetical protein